jgi:hypothetical protein
VLQIGSDQASVALQHFANQEEVFLVIAYQEDSQRGNSQLCCCQHMVTIGIWEEKFNDSMEREIPMRTKNPESACAPHRPRKAVTSGPPPTAILDLAKRGESWIIIRPFQGSATCVDPVSYSSSL